MCVRLHLGTSQAPKQTQPGEFLDQTRLLCLLTLGKVLIPAVPGEVCSAILFQGHYEQSAASRRHIKLQGQSCVGACSARQCVSLHQDSAFLGPSAARNVASIQPAVKAVQVSKMC